jgi:hypothetical protein
MPSRPTTGEEADRQLPLGEEIFLDHIGHFVRDPQAAGRALERAGFAPAPISIQVNPDGTPTGTGNVTAMLTRGYVEVLFKTADTPLGQEFEAALSQHAGLHLAAFAVADAQARHRQLGEAGFPMRPLVQFQRPVSTETGEGIAAFTVVRVERGAMAEGRVQMLTHRTEDTVWQTRWLSHPNGATGLLDLAIASVDVDEAAARFSRFTNCASAGNGWGKAVQLDRGRIQLCNADAFQRLFPELIVPRLPFMGAYGIAVHSLDETQTMLAKVLPGLRRDGAALVVPFPDELGLGAWVFVERAADLPWRR